MLTAPARTPVTDFESALDPGQDSAYGFQQVLEAPPHDLRDQGAASGGDSMSCFSS
jgi:hypothetical protein